MTDYLTAAMAMLGPAENRHADPPAWNRLQEELGVELPADYKTVVDAYAPIQINGHLYLHHPATERWNLAEQIQDTVRAWSDVSWNDVLDPDEDPRLLLGLTELTFGTDPGLWPITSTDRGETVFLVTGADAPWLLVADGDLGWSRYDMTFTEWLYRYLTGEDMAGPNSSAFYPGPVTLQRLPMTTHERPEPWHGPSRGM